MQAHLASKLGFAAEGVKRSAVNIVKKGATLHPLLRAILALDMLVLHAEELAEISLAVTRKGQSPLSCSTAAPPIGAQALPHLADSPASRFVRSESACPIACR